MCRTCGAAASPSGLSAVRFRAPDLLVHFTRRSTQPRALPHAPEATPARRSRPSEVKGNRVAAAWANLRLSIRQVSGPIVPSSRFSLSRQFGPPSARRHPPVDAFQQHRQLRRRQAGRTVFRRRPNDAAFFQPLREQAKALAVPAQHLDRISPAAAKDEQLVAERILAQMVLSQ